MCNGGGVAESLCHSDLDAQIRGKKLCDCQEVGISFQRCSWLTGSRIPPQKVCLFFFLSSRVRQALRGQHSHQSHSS